MLRFGPITLVSPFCQAGLAGYSDRAMRIVARRRGCAFALTEALNDEQVALGGNAVRRRLVVADEDHPLAGQIMGSEPEMMARAARELVALGHDVVDVNVACPVRKQARPRGGHLLADPERAIAILRAVRDAVPAHVPTTLKLRRGTDDDPQAAERFHRILEAAFEAGYAAACVHGRTVRQGYRGRASWQFLTDLTRRLPGRTLLGSGDVFSPEAAVALLRASGMAGVWIARGAIGNPWIFAEAAALANGAPVPPPPTIGARSAAAIEELLEQYYRVDGPGVRPPPELIDEVNPGATA